MLISLFKRVFLIGALLNAAYLQAQVNFGSANKLNAGWKFLLADDSRAKNISFNDKNWQNIRLPHDWSVKGKLDSTLASCTGYLPGGIGWYRKTLNIPQSQEGKKVYLYFEGVYNRSEVYLNGQLLGKRPNGYISFMYDATPHIKYGKENTLAVRVDHSQSADSRWYSGSGIYRNVWLVYANPLHIAQWGVFAHPQVAGNKGTLKVEVAVTNGNTVNQNITVQNQLFSPDGKEVAQSSTPLMAQAGQQGKINAVLTITSPKLWSVSSPTQYKLVTKILTNGKVIDQTTTLTGFRTFTFDANKGFALNGKSMKMKGVCLHHDAGVLGAAVPKEVWRKRILALKEVGVNAIRTTHNPHATDMYALCDELGMLVMNEAYDEWEFPKRKWLQGWNVGTPGHDGTFDFFEEWGEKDLADMVQRDRNHISIFAWSIGNEVDYPNDPYSHPILDQKGEGFTQKSFGGYKKDAPDANRLGKIAERLVAVVKKYDTSRPVTAGLAGVSMSNETTYPGLLDIAGYNYTEDRYAMDHKKYPSRILFGSENRHDLKAWKAVTDNDYIFGQFLWTGIDYLGESGKWPSRGFYSGLLDFTGAIKPRGYFRQSLWSDKPMAYLGSYSIDKNAKHLSEDVLSQTEQSDENGKKVQLSTDAWSVWNYRNNENIRVVCYTNTAKAQLMLNGKKIGEAKSYDTKTGIIYWDIPFTAGKIEVLGLDKQGKEQARYAIATPQKAHAIKIVAADSKIARQDGVSQITLQVIDDKGVLVDDAINEITCQINGEGVLLGLEAGNNADMGDYTDNKQNVYKGKLTAYISAKGQAGDIKVTFTSKGLKSDEITIKAN